MTLKNLFVPLAVLITAVCNAHVKEQSAGSQHDSHEDRDTSTVRSDISGTTAIDTLAALRRACCHMEQPLFDKLGENNMFRAACISFPIITSGLLLRSEDAHFRHNQNGILPDIDKKAEFNYHETYLQYLPLAVTLGLKACGVKSRSSWPRMLVSGAAGAAIMAAVVQTMKHTIKTERPDRSDDHSFPSGHTATAFMTATILHHEYGHIHPLISIGGYTTAAVTGLLRINNNRHWISDVTTGAGIGILAAELGYCIGDALFSDKGLNLPSRREEHIIKMAKPTFIGIRTGYNIPLNDFKLANGLKFRTSGGCNIAVEGAYFFNPYIGIGGLAGMSSHNIIVNNYQSEPDRLRFANVAAGAYVSYPISTRWLAGTKLVADYVKYGNLKLVDYTLKGSNGAGVGAGLSLTFRARRNMSVKFSADYDLLPPVSHNGGKYFNILTLGATTAINL